MLGWCGLGLSVVFLLIPMAASQTCTSAGTPGMPGIPGLPGYDGRNGQKGEKGDPGLPMSHGQVSGQRGQKGEPGMKGKLGKIGKSGIPGPPGGPGPIGPQGEPGDSGSSKSPLQSAFSVRRNTRQLPERGRPVRFTSEITNTHGHYDTTSGKFDCQISGTYYFAYHASLQRNLCASLVMDGVDLAKFCDHIMPRVHQQVSSGGLAVYVKKGQKVWVATDTNNNMYGEGGKGDSVFSGFLVYAH